MGFFDEWEDEHYKIPDSQRHLFLERLPLRFAERPAWVLINPEKIERLCVYLQMLDRRR